MTPLPQRRKSAEELAALRASLGIPETAETAAAPVAAEETAPAAAFEAVEPEPVIHDSPPRLRVSKSLRKSEQVPIEPRPRAVAASGKLPARRRSERELRQIQQSSGPPTIDPAQRLMRMELRWWGVLGVYLVSFAGPLFALIGILSSHAQPMDLPRWWGDVVFAESARQTWMFATAAGVLLMLLSAGWLTLFKKRAAHHAALLTIAAVLVLTAGILYFFPEIHGT
ncbi:MAG: hypothetical protein MUF31_05780 [Akkermansiaceae bacterium]|nr:hypothetical protein [Akkermansiaceae bacterium]